MPTTRVLGKTYCPQCGWNREAAEKQTRLLLRLLPVLVIVFDAPLIVWIFLGHAEIPALAALGALAIVPVILVVLAVRGKVRVEALGTASVQSAAAGSITAPGNVLAKQYTAIVELQRPRAVRMSRQGKMNTAILSISLLAFAGALVTMVMFHPASPAVGPASGNNATPPRPVVYVLVFGLVAAITFAMRRSLTQQRWLLTLGDLAMARVTKQWTARNGHGIRYEFTTPAGETFSRMTTDYARLLLVGMSVPIFYDSQRPKKQVGLCAAFYEVVLPGED
jgi:hypothetical protein